MMGHSRGWVSACRALCAGVGLCAAVGAARAAAVAPRVSANTSARHSLTLSEPAREIQSLFNLGSTYVDRKDYTSAEYAYQQILRHEHARPEDQRRAMLDLAHMYRLKGSDTRAVACYEKYLKQFPDDTAVPRVYLDLGRALRSLGAYRMALNSFYSVINTTLKLSGDDFEQYRALAKTAQFEIAETHFEEGDFEEASRFFIRLQLLELAPADRAHAQFKSAYALMLAKDYAEAVSALRKFLDQYPDDENGPEARYLLSVSLRRLGRNQEAFDTVLTLLRTEKKRQAADPQSWIYWQRRTGNEVANEFYEQGNFWSALVIYESLAALAAKDPVWRLPALYQAGLCYERLRQYDRAEADYKAVIDACAAIPAKEQAASGLNDLNRMASWRLQHLGWTEKIDLQLAQLFRTLPLPTHDSPGPAVQPSSAVR